MRPIEEIFSKGKRRLAVAKVFFVSCILLSWSPVDAQPPEIDFSITKSMLQEGPGPFQGDLVRFYVTGTMPPSPGFITGTLQVVITDTIPPGLNLGGFIGPPNWQCGVLTTTLPLPGGNKVQSSIVCGSVLDQFVTQTQHFPMVITTTVGTPDTEVLTQTVRISADSSFDFDDPPSNNFKAVIFQVNPEKVKPVPALGEWGMLVFMVLLGVAVVYAIRKKKFN